MIKNKFILSYMVSKIENMKYVFILFILISQSALAQTNVFKKIAQRHDIYTASAWNGADSFRWDYNSNAIEIQRTALKLNSSGVWTNIYRYTFTITSFDSIAVQLNENWNGTSWVNSKRITYDYDANHNNTAIHYDNWNGSTWVPLGKMEFSGYNSKHKYTGEVNYIWNGSGWDFLSKDIYQYYSNDTQLMIHESYDWNSTTFVWDGYERYYYTYYADSVGTETKLLPVTSGWVESTKKVFTYATSPLRRTLYTTQNWDTSVVPNAWKDDRKTAYTYNTNLKLTLAQRDKNSSGGWIEEQRYNYVYNGSNQLTEFYDELYLGGWQNNSRSLYTYSSDSVSQELTFTGAGSSWYDDKKISYLFDANNLKTFRQIDTFNGATFHPNNRDFYYYNMFTVNTNDITQSISNIETYPNPANGQMNIRFTSDELFYSSIRLIDMNGNVKIMNTQPIFKGRNQLKLDVSNLPSGNYLMQIMDNDHGGQTTQHIQVVH